MFIKCPLNAQSRGSGFLGGGSGVADAGRRCFTGHFSDGGVIVQKGEEGTINLQESQSWKSCIHIRTAGRAWTVATHC